MINTTDTRFDADVLESDQPVLVDFWATWCGPCRMMSPVLEQIEEERDDVRVVKLDTDENPATMARYEVLGVPTFILFKNGAPVLRLVGSRPKGRLNAELSAVLEEAPELIAEQARGGR